jgi:exonuclease I
MILMLELKEQLGFGELIEQYLTESRQKNARLFVADLLRQSVYSRPDLVEWLHNDSHEQT